MAEAKASIIIKKKGGGGHGGGHGGAWKVAYADFVTAMMAFFMVMWLMGSDDETKEAISHYFNHPNSTYKSGRDPASKAVHPMGELTGEGDSVLSGLAGLNPDDLVPNPARSDQYLKQYKEIQELLAEVLKNKVFGVDLSIDYLKFSVRESNIFVEGTNHLKPTANKVLDPIGRILSNYKGYVVIEDHTDSDKVNDVKLGSVYEASIIKAVAVMGYLVDKQWIAENHVTPVGSGTKKKFTTDESEGNGATDENAEKNRRIEFTLTHDKNY